MQYAVALLLAATLAGCAPPVRTLSVRLLADDSFRRRPDWQNVARRRLSAASKPFEQSARLRLQARTIAAWDGPAPAPDDWRAQLEILSATAPEDLVVGLTSHATGDHLGSVLPFESTAVVIDFPGRAEADNTAILAHELAHLFAAIHSGDPASVMHPSPTALRLDPPTAALVRLLVRHDFRRGASAIPPDLALAVAATLAGDPAAEPLEIRARTHAELAAFFRSRKQTDTAIALATEAVRLHPNDEWMRLSLGLLLKDAHRWTAAEAEFRQAADLAPDNLESRVNLAICLARQRRTTEAFALLRRLARQAPDSPLARHNLGAIFLEELGAVDDAVEQFQAALTLDPHFDKARRALTAALRQRNENDHETLAARAALRAEPRNASAHARLGVALARQGKFADSIAELRAAVALDPFDWRRRNALAVALFASGRYDDAWRETDAVQAAGGQPEPGLLSALRDLRAAGK